MARIPGSTRHRRRILRREWVRGTSVGLAVAGALVGSQVFGAGSASAATSPTGPTVVAAVSAAPQPTVGVASTSGSGIYTATTSGSVATAGGATPAGNLNGVRLAAPVVGITSTPDGKGYWMVGADGGIFAFGDAGFYGSMGGRALNAPVVGMATTPDGRGYWLVASDGGVFTFGASGFYGSMGNQTLTKPVVGMASSGRGGYWLVASDGGIFTFGAAAFEGSLGGQPGVNAVGMAPAPSASGYDLALSNGGVVQFTPAATPPPVTTPPVTTPPVTTPPVTAPPVTTPPVTAPPVATRTLAAWPFSASSPWNTPLGAGATFLSAADPESVSIDDNGGAVNGGAWSQPVYEAAATDPMNTVVANGGQTFSYQIPANATPAQGSDANLDVIAPDGTTLHECWQMQRTGPTTWTCSYLVTTSLAGSGFGTGGTRADGGSAIGGLIRTSELQSGVIPHALAIALGASQLRSGYVWPATSQDGDAATSYSGTVPMGSLLAIPANVNLASLGLSPAGLAVATALQDSGGYVSDRSAGLTLYAEPAADGTLLNEVRADMAKIVPDLRVVSNNGPSSTGGIGVRLAAMAPAATN